MLSDRLKIDIEVVYAKPSFIARPTDRCRHLLADVSTAKFALSVRCSTTISPPAHWRIVSGLMKSSRACDRGVMARLSDAARSVHGVICLDS